MKKYLCGTHLQNIRCQHYNTTTLQYPLMATQNAWFKLEKVGRLS